jgi:hypothetical protein
MGRLFVINLDTDLKMILVDTDFCDWSYMIGAKRENFAGVPVSSEMAL